MKFTNMGAFERLSDDLRKDNLVISPSALMEFAISPKHYYAAYVLKEKEQTEAMFEGELVHKIVLEPDKFLEKYAVLDSQENYLVTIDDLKREIELLGEKPTKGKKGDLINQLLAIEPNSKIWDTYIERMNEQGKRLVDFKTYNKLTRIAQEVKSHSWLAKTMAGGMIEQQAWFKHETGVYLSMRMDFFNEKTGIKKIPLVLDVKKVRTAHPMEFQKTLYKYRLFIQVAVYVDCINAILGLNPYAGFVLTEFDSPYITEVVACNEAVIDAGRQTYNKLIRKFIECHETNRWPGYTDGICTNVSLPAYAFDQLDFDADQEIGGME